MNTTYKDGDMVGLKHPVRGDSVGSHKYRIVDVDACHYYVCDVYTYLVHKVRLDAVRPWPGVEYGQA